MKEYAIALLFLLTVGCAPAWAGEGYGGVTGDEGSSGWKPICSDREDGLTPVFAEGWSGPGTSKYETWIQLQPVQLHRSACLMRDKAVAALTQRHGEVQVALGTHVSGKIVFELFVQVRDAAPRAWTILRTDTKGLSCIMAVGKDWIALEPVPIGPPT